MITETPSTVEDIGGATRLFAIVGDPIAQVKSPGRFNPKIRAAGHDAVLIPLHVKSVDFDNVMAKLLAVANIDGFIMTVPFKERILPLVNEISRRARQVGAANVIRREPQGGWIGDMFDGVGLIGAVRGLGVDPKGLRTGLIGAGGAGSAIGFALAASGVFSLQIADIDAQRADRLAKRISAESPDAAVSAGSCDPKGLDLIINASPVGMAPGDCAPIDVSKLTAAHTVIDIVTDPAVTPLLAGAARAGARYTGGGAMVEAQAEAILDFFDLSDR